MGNVPDDKAQIRELIESWVVWRDSGDWDRLRTVWHADGGMSASWRQGTADQFIESNKKGWPNGEVDILHQLGGSTIRVEGGRAISMTKMVISQRATLHGVRCDVSAQARHFDFWEQRDGRWGLVQRETIFDRDRIDMVVPGEVVSLDPEVLGKFPVNYQHLAYLQSTIGFPVRTDIPRLRSEESDALYAKGERWLASEEPFAELEMSGGSAIAL
jgi:SnoaL-like domain